MRRPRLDHDHIASEQTRRVGATSGIGFAPKHNPTIDVCRVSQYFVKLDSEAVEMADVQWAKIGIEAIVDETIVDGKVGGGRSLGAAGDGGGTSVLRLGRALVR